MTRSHQLSDSCSSSACLLVISVISRRGRSSRSKQCHQSAIAYINGVCSLGSQHPLLHFCRSSKVHLSERPLKESAMSKTFFTAILVVVVALIGIVNVVDAQAGSQYYGNGYNYGYQPSNYLTSYPQQFAYGDGVGADSWQRSVVRHILWP